jgi:hypothetical protein
MKLIENGVYLKALIEWSPKIHCISDLLTSLGFSDVYSVFVFFGTVSTLSLVLCCFEICGSHALARAAARQDMPMGVLFACDTQ